jgi:hypothetical protein
MQRHELDVVSLVFGGLFTGTGLLYLAGNVPLVNIDGRWLWPVVLILVGLSLLASLRRSRPDAEERERHP